MRIAISSDMDHDEALARANGRKRVGRKHNHQPRGRAIERRKRAQKIALQHEALLRRKFSERVAAFWRGEIECFPSLA